MKQTRDFVLPICVLLVGLWAGSCSKPTQPQSAEALEFEVSWEYLQIFFLFRDSLPADPYIYPTPKELYESVHEPYTVYIPPDEANHFLTSLTTQVSGRAGVRIDSSAGGFFLNEVIPNSPAFSAGLLEGDTLITINDSAVAGRTVKGVIDLIAGAQGDSRTFVVRRDTAVITATFQLGTFRVPSVYVDSIDTTVAYIEITQFADSTVVDGGTAAEFRNALAQTSWAAYTLLDLRHNPGGYLHQSIQVASEFLSPGTDIARFRQRYAYQYDDSHVAAQTQDTIYQTSGGGSALNRNFIVLSDSFTASAAELLISVLREQRGFSLVGQTTYGKARGQVLQNTPSKGLVKITYALITPIEGPTYDLVGLQPDVVSASSHAAIADGVALAHQKLGAPVAKMAKVRLLARRLQSLHDQDKRPWTGPLGIERESNRLHR